MVLGITGLLLVAIANGRASAAHEADAHLLLQAEYPSDGIDDDAELADPAGMTATRARPSVGGDDLRTLEASLRHALDRAPDGPCELKFSGDGVVAICR